ncbi:MAG: hypothetical protein AB7I27_11190 [Bacteriovoracaceae bacterium]
MLKIFFCFLALITIGCGKKDKDSNLKSSQELQSSSIVEGEYYSQIRPINTRVNGIINSGIAEIKIIGEQFEIKLYMDDLGSTSHKQFIYSGSKCPSPSDDLNGDKIIDFDEIRQVSGEPLIPLDGDLNSQEAGKEVFPNGRSYDYTKKATVSSLLNDLKVTDNNPSDYLTKLKSNEKLNFDSRVIIIFGAPNVTSVPIPNSVFALNNGSINQNIPVACGMIKKVL